MTDTNTTTKPGVLDVNEAYRYWRAQPLITRPFNCSADAAAAAAEEIGSGWRATHSIRETPSGWFVSELAMR